MNRFKFQPLWLLLAFGFALVSLPGIAPVAYAQTDDDDDPAEISAFDTFIEAAAAGDIEAVRRSLRAGVDVNARDEAGYTALMLASASGRVAMVKFLLAHGANCALKDSAGFTALQHAQKAKEGAVVVVLRGAKSPSSIREKSSVTAPQKRLPVRVAARPATKRTKVKRNKAAAPVRSLPAGRAIAGGLYFQVKTFFNGTSLSINQEHFAFWPDGRFYKGVPKGGLESFNFAAARRQEPSACGTYSIAGGKITFRMADGKVETHDFKRADGGFNLDGLFASRQKSYKPNQRLVGLYDGGASVTGGGSYIASVKSLRFTGNGTFQGSSIGAVSANTAAGTVNGKSETADAGTYSLSGNTLVLRHNGGSVTRHTVYPYDMGGGKTAINVDGVMLHHRK